MGRWINLTFWFLYLAGSVVASGMEPVEFAVRHQKFRTEAVYVLIENPVQPKPAPRDALPEPMRYVPGDVWRDCIIPRLPYADQLRLSRVCMLFNRHVKSVPEFSRAVRSKLDVQYTRMFHWPAQTPLVNYARNTVLLRQMLDRFPGAAAVAPSQTLVEAGRAAHEKLWKLRHVQQFDQIVLRQECERYGVQTHTGPLEWLAARQTGFHFRHPNVEAALQWVVPTSVVLAITWPLIQPSVWPTSLVSGTPWVNFSVPLYRWDKFFQNQPYDSHVFFIDILPYLFHYSWQHIIPSEVLLQANTNKTVHVVLDSLQDSISYSGFTFRLAIGIPYGLLVFWRMGQLIYNKPTKDLNDLTITEAYGYHRRTQGLLGHMYYGKRLWLVGKVLVSAGFITALAFNIKDLYDFIGMGEAQFTEVYNEAVREVYMSYVADYMGYATYLGQQLRDSPVNPWRCENYEACFPEDFCFTYLSADTFRNNTDLFVSQRLIEPVNEGSNYENGVLRYPLIYVPCWMTFNVLTKYAIINANTTVNVLYKYGAGAVVTGMSQNILHHGGYWAPVLLPQVMMVLHIIYMMFIDVW